MNASVKEEARGSKASKKYNFIKFSNFIIFTFLLGVPRRTAEDWEFANFDIFPRDKTTPYSTFNFTYEHRDFQRLWRLTEFNTLKSLDKVYSVDCNPLLFDFLHQGVASMGNL